MYNYGGIQHISNVCVIIIAIGNRCLVVWDSAHEMFRIMTYLPKFNMLYGRCITFNHF